MIFEIYSEAESYYTDVKFIPFLPLKTFKFVLILKMVLSPWFYAFSIKNIDFTEKCMKKATK